METMNAVPNLRSDVIYLDGHLIRMEAMLPCGQVRVFDDDGHQWQPAGWAIGGDGPVPTVALVPELDAWLAAGKNRARLTQTVCDYYRSVT